MIDLDERLARGPLRVRSVWSGASPEGVRRRMDRRRRAYFVLDLAALCVCLALGFVGSWRTRGAAVSTVFSDGSVAELSTHDSEIRVEHDGPGRTVSRLIGGARFRVVHDPRRTFEVRAGDVLVRVLGTVFSVQQVPSGQAQVLVESGRVEVAWLGGATVLQAGQGGVFPPPGDGDPDPRSEAPATSTAVPSPAPSAAPPSTPNRATQAAGAWREYARAGEYVKAYDDLRGHGMDAVRDEAADLLLAADTARLSGHPADAVRPLRALCDRHSGDRSAPVAAFTLGRVLLDDLGQPVESALAFRRAHNLWPSGPLAEDALSREAEAWQRGGRTEEARASAEKYLSRYPSGRHAPEMRKVLSE